MLSVQLARCALAAAIMLTTAPALAQKPGDTGFLTWAEAKAKVEAHWAGTYPTEHVLGIDAKGGVEYSSTERVTESDWWWSSTYEVSGSYARQAALVLVERANKSRARFEVAALYHGVNKKYIFDKIVVGPVVEVGMPGAPTAPTNTVAIGLFFEAWTRERPDFAVRSVTVEGMPARNHSGDRHWINYKLAIEAVGTAQGSKQFASQKVKCTPADYASVLKWDATKSGWIVDDSAVRNVNETGVCNVVP